METRLDGDGTLGATFITMLTRLRALQEVPVASGTFAARRDRAKVIQAEYDARRQAALSRRSVSAATLGEELARFQTVDATLQQQIGHDLDQHPVGAAVAFAALAPAIQAALLQSSSAWASLDRPWIIPALQLIYESWKGGKTGPSAGDLALQRLYELAPDDSRRMIIDEIRTGEHLMGYDVLAILPDASLPELDEPLQARYTSPRRTDQAIVGGDRTMAAWLIARYGSAKLLPFVTGVLARSGAACADEAALIAYLLKYDPTSGMQRLNPTFNRAGICVVAPLRELATHAWNARVESATITQLMDTNSRNVREAAQLLGSHGSSAAKQPLLDRLARWSAEWQAAPPKLAAMPSNLSSPAGIEESVTNALFLNKEIVLTAADATHILGWCVTDSCRAHVTAMIHNRGIK